MHFCWLPPERLVTGTSPPAVLIASSLIDQSTARRLGARVDQRRRPVSSGRRRIVMFSATVIRSKRPSVLRSSVTSATPAAIASSGCVNRTGPAVEPDRARRRLRAGAEDGFEQLGPPGAQQPGDAQHLAGVDLRT